MIGSLAIFPDLGNATILALVALIMYTVSGIAHRWFIAFIGVLFGVSALSLTAIDMIGVDKFSKVPVFGYVAKRFSAYFNPFADLAGAGHQLANSYFAMVNGGWFGLGLGNSIEKRGYLPEAHTDFVFSIVIEEFGFVGASLILALVFFLILRIILVGIRAKNPFNSMMAIGVRGDDVGTGLCQYRWNFWYYSFDRSNFPFLIARREQSPSLVCSHRLCFKY